jgi:hypothetical protein
MTKSEFSLRLEAAKTNMKLDVWLYGELRMYAEKANQIGYAQVEPEVPEGFCMRDLLALLNMPSPARGITFVNGNLSALPGFQPDLGHVFQNGDRVALFDLRSMWPFQYRNGAAMTEAMRQAIAEHPEELLHHEHSAEE